MNKEKRKIWTISSFICILCAINFLAGVLTGIREKNFLNNWDPGIHPFFLKNITILCLFLSYLILTYAFKKKTTPEGTTNENTADRS